MAVSDQCQTIFINLISTCTSPCILKMELSAWVLYVSNKINIKFVISSSMFQSILYYYYYADSANSMLFTDPTLTVDVLVDVMEKLTSDEERRRKVWRRVLRWENATPSSYIDEVYTQLNTSAREKTQTLSDVYVNITPESSWQHLVRILYGQSELAAAKQAKSYLPVNGG